MNYDPEQFHEAAVLVDAGHDFLADNGLTICILVGMYLVYRGFVAYLEYRKAIFCKRRNTDESA